MRFDLTPLVVALVLNLSFISPVAGALGPEGANDPVRRNGWAGKTPAAHSLTRVAVPEAIRSQLQVYAEAVARPLPLELAASVPALASMPAGDAGANGGEVVLVVAILLLILIDALVASCGGGKQAYDFGC